MVGNRTPFKTQTDPAVAIVDARRQRGQRAYLSGCAAEDAVAQKYRAMGYTVLAQRWRGQAGEIDLVLTDGTGFVFAEVKKAKTLDLAINRLSQTQAQRIHLAALEFVDDTPLGQLSDMRFDLALCDGHGNVDIRKALFSHF